ncbi:hypothetical protein JCM6882_000892 [Rhodosporidiobolus microsporus]
MAPSAAPPTSTLAPQQDLHDALRSRLVSSGEYSRVLETLKAKLDEAGWEDQVRDVAREKARAQSQPSLKGLVDELEPTALGMIPPEVRAEVEAMVRAFVEKSVE